MKYLLYTAIAFILPLQLFSQALNIVHNEPPHQYLVGKLEKLSPGVYQKYKIEIFGGNWHSNNVGECPSTGGSYFPAGRTKE